VKNENVYTEVQFYTWGSAMCFAQLGYILLGNSNITGSVNELGIAKGMEKYYMLSNT